MNRRNAFGMPDADHATLHEPSAWMRARLDRQAAAIARLGLDRFDGVVVAPLGERLVPGSREDRTCDRCRTYCREGEPFYPLSFSRPGLVLVGGLYRGCVAREQVTP